MYGDIYGWGQVTNVAVAHAEAPAEQLLEPLNDDRTQWDPWTKRCIRGRGALRLWCWEWKDCVWHAALYYFLGCIMFVVGSAAALLQPLYDHPSLQMNILTAPYFVGSVLFTIGSILLIIESSRIQPAALRNMAASGLITPGGTHTPGTGCATPRASGLGGGNCVATSECGEDGDGHNDAELAKKGGDGESKLDLQPLLSHAHVERSNISLPPGLPLERDKEAEGQSFYRRWFGRWTVAMQAEARGTVHATETARPDDLDDLLGAFYLRDPDYHIKADPWHHTGARADMFGAISICIGAILYNVSCGTELWELMTGEMPFARFPHEQLKFWLITAPNVTGGVLFVLGSQAYWVAAHHTWVPLRAKSPGTVTYWITLLNLLGSIGFWLGAQFTQPILNYLPDLLIPNWTEIFVGYVLGSAAFLVGSYLMIVQIGSSV